MPSPPIQLFLTTIASGVQVRQRQEHILRILQVKKIPYTSYDLASPDSEDAKRLWKRKAPRNEQSLPGILVGGEWPGNFAAFEEAAEFGELDQFLRLNESWDEEEDGDWHPAPVDHPVGVPGAFLPLQMNPEHKPTIFEPTAPIDKEALRQRAEQEFDVSTELSGYGLDGVMVTEDDLAKLVEELGLGGDDAEGLIKGLGGGSGKSEKKAEPAAPEASKPSEVMSGIPVPTSSIPRFQPSSNDGVRSRTSLDKQPAVSGIPVPVSPSSIPRPLSNDTTRSRTSIDAPVAAGIASTTSLPSPRSMSGSPVATSGIPRFQPSSNDGVRSRTSLDKQPAVSGIPVPVSPSSIPRPLSNDSTRSRTSIDAPVAARIASTTSLPYRRSMSLDLPNPFDKDNKRAPSSDYQRGMSQGGQRSAIPVPAKSLPSPKTSKPTPLPVHSEFGQAPPPGIPGNLSLPLPPPAAAPASPRATPSRNYSLPLAHPKNRPDSAASVVPPPAALRLSMEGSRIPVAKPRMAPVVDDPDAQFPRAMQQAPAGAVQIVTQPKGNQGMEVGPKSAGSTMSDSSSEKKHEKDEYTHLDNKPRKKSFWCC